MPAALECTSGGDELSGSQNDHCRGTETLRKCELDLSHHEAGSYWILASSGTSGDQFRQTGANGPVLCDELVARARLPNYVENALRRVSRERRLLDKCPKCKSATFRQTRAPWT